MTFVPNRLQGVFSKIDRAQYHFDRLNLLVSKYLTKKPFSVDTLKQTHNGEYAGITHYILRINKYPDSILNLYFGDFIHNLRTSLDNLAWELAILNGNESSDHIYFPIHDSETNFEKERNNYTKKFGSKALTVISDAKPYKGGNEIFFNIRSFDNFDKHRSLLISFYEQQGIRLDFSKLFSIDGSVFCPMRKGRPDSQIKDGGIICSAAELSGNQIMLPDIEGVFTLAFGDESKCVPIYGLVEYINLIRSFCLKFIPFFK